MSNGVVVGNNGASRGGIPPYEESFSVCAGWDAVSGADTPISDFFANLENHFNVSQLERANNSAVSSVSDNVTSGIRVMGNFTMVLLAAAVVANVAIGIVVIVTLVKRWRSRYTPLDDVASSSKTPNASSATYISQTKQLNADADSINSFCKEAIHWMYCCCTSRIFDLEPDLKCARMSSHVAPKQA